MTHGGPDGNSRRGFEDALEDYLKEFSEILREVREETYKRHKTEAEKLLKLIDNWIDLLQGAKGALFPQIANSLSGLILFNSWKLTNWISYEILNGKYFEAMRDLRFVFEGSVYAVIVEDAIESAVYERWGTLSDISLKADIFRLWEECRKSRVVKGRGEGVRVDAGKVRGIVREYVGRNLDPSEGERAREYVELYTEILSDERLYLSVGKMIEECRGLLGLDEGDVEKLERLWHELSRYVHFSHPYLRAIMDDPEFSMLEKPNDELLETSVALYLQTMDFLYAVLAWRFRDLRESIEGVCKWWRDNFGETFDLAERTLRRMEELEGSG